MWVTEKSVTSSQCFEILLVLKGKSVLGITYVYLCITRNWELGPERQQIWVFNLKIQAWYSKVKCKEFGANSEKNYIY